MLSSTPDAVGKILQYTTVAANALQDVAAATHIPFLNNVCTLSLAIIPIVQDTKFQKEQCLRIVEEMHQLLCAVMNLCIHSDDIRSPQMLNHIAQWASTLLKFQSCLRAQQELGTIKRLFKKSETAAQLDTCEREMRATLETFTAEANDKVGKMNNGVGITSALVEFRTNIERRHQELLELISLQSESFDSESSEGITTTQMHRSSLNTSSGSFSLLPASPKIFHGRDSELKDLVSTLVADPARVAILGPGGMGENNFSDGRTSSSNCHQKIYPQTFYFVEEFLSLLADTPSLALMVTMRGAERPGKMKWTRPVLPPLEPLSPSASRQIFLEVADEPSSEEESALDTLLDLSDSLPLA
ncbi:hypothetical protein B0H14DRAFT_2623957, partial [Mycena olivaceomarginata]